MSGENKFDEDVVGLMNDDDDSQEQVEQVDLETQTEDNRQPDDKDSEPENKDEQAPEQKDTQKTESKDEDAELDDDAIESRLAEASGTKGQEDDKPKEGDTVPLAKYLEEKRARQEAERKAERAAGAREVYERLPAQQGQQQETLKDPYDELDDGDIPTVVQQKAHEAYLEEKNRRARENEEKKRQSQQVSEYEQRCSEHEQDLMGKTASLVSMGLDYETVVRIGRENLAPKHHKQILNSENPPKTAYNLCIQQTPTLRKKFASLKNAAHKKTTTTKTGPNRQVQRQTQTNQEQPPSQDEIEQLPAETVEQLYDQNANALAE